MNTDDCGIYANGPDYYLLSLKPQLEGPVCPHCGNAITAEMNFCPECGAKMHEKIPNQNG